MKTQIDNYVLWSSRILLSLLFLLSIESKGVAQRVESYQKEKISLEVKEMPLEEVIHKIEEIAKVHFFFNHSQLDLKKKITYHAKNQNLDYVILNIFGPQKIAIDYQPNRTILLKPEVKHPILSIQKINGVVLDAKTEEPLVGASIIMKEKQSMGVVTDLDGKFFIEVPTGISALIVSYIGYNTDEIQLKAETKELIIKLMPKSTEMDDVVVTGMAPRKVEGFTGDYVSVKGEELKKLSPNNLLKALQMFDPSFRIVTNNQRGSDPNTLPEFHMRGDVQIGDFEGNKLSMMLGDYSNRPNMPLFILNGFESTLQRIVDLDPERVESITILKDAAATAIYGSRAANGVVVFETKKPKSGKLNVSYSTNVGITVPDLSDYNLMNAAEKLQFEKDAKLFDPNNAEHMNYYNHYLREIQQGVDTYWLSEPLRTAVTHRHSMSFDGGDDALRYGVNVNYNATPGVMKESDRNSMGMDISLQYRRKKWNVNNQLMLSNTVGNNTPYGSFSEYTRLNPYYRKTDEMGRYLQVIERKNMGAGNEMATITNPLYNTQFPFKDRNDNFSITNNLAVECAIRDNLRASAEVSFTKSSAKSEKFLSKSHTSFAEEEDLTKRGSYVKDIGNSFTWSANASINYNLTAKKHLLSTFLRWNIEESKSDGVNLSAKGFPNDNMDDFLFAYEMDNRVNGSESTNRSLGVIMSASYMYDYRYSVDFSLRGDMSSQFGADQSLKPFWAVGARWNISREPWLAGTMISNLVVRGSIGLTGSQNYAAYQAMESYNFDNLMFPYLSSDVLGAELMGFGNPDLDWSKTKNRSVAFEIGFFKDRLTASLNYYNNLTDQLLLDYSLSPSSGFATMKNNAGSIVNEGFDFSVNGLLVQDYERQIQWSVMFNGSHNRNKIKKISNVVKAMNEENLKRKDAPVPIYEEGKSTSMLFVVPSMGIDPATGREVFIKRDGSKTFIWDPTDKIAIGDSEPKLRGGLSTSITYKDFSLTIGGTYEFGKYTYNETLVSKIENASIGYNVDKRAAKDRWRQSGDITKYKGIHLIGQNTEMSSRFVQKVQEIQFTNLSIGYRLDPKKIHFLEKCRIASVSLTGAMENLAIFSTIKQERGLDYPFARSFSLSLSVLFN